MREEKKRSKRGGIWKGEIKLRTAADRGAPRYRGKNRW